jgi:hypothetical protein
MVKIRAEARILSNRATLNKTLSTNFESTSHGNLGISDALLAYCLHLSDLPSGNTHSTHTGSVFPSLFLPLSLPSPFDSPEPAAHFMPPNQLWPVSQSCSHPPWRPVPSPPLPPVLPTQTLPRCSDPRALCSVHHPSLPPDPSSPNPAFRSRIAFSAPGSHARRKHTCPSPCLSSWGQDIYSRSPCESACS